MDDWVYELLTNEKVGSAELLKTILQRKTKKVRLWITNKYFLKKHFFGNEKQDQMIIDQALIKHKQNLHYFEICLYILKYIIWRTEEEGGVYLIVMLWYIKDSILD